jgi:peroxiredoxin
MKPRHTLAFLFALAVAACGGTQATSPGDAGGDRAATPKPQDCTTTLLPTCPTAPAPAWQLYDFQPKSAGFQQTYGLERFKGKVVLVGLLAAWCPFCQSQIAKMEELLAELTAMGKDVAFVVVNSADAEPQQQNFVDRASFPLFQDTQAVNAWKLQGGAKDDFYVYGRDGKLAQYLPISGAQNLTLSTPEGYGNLKNAILAAVAK